jgi:FkbH-like protein
MNSGTVQIELISDFNLQTLANYLENGESSPAVSVQVAPFGQVIPSLLASGEESRDKFAFVWTNPAAVVPTFATALRGETVKSDDALAEVQQFAQHVIAARDRFRSVLVCTWTLPHWQRGLGLLDLQNPSGLRHLLLKMNLELISSMDGAASVYLMDPQAWIEAGGKTAYSSKLWYLSKNPFGPEVLKHTASEIKAAVRTINGDSRKLIVTDLDDTLWGGVVGDVGWEGLQLGGHDHIGEAFVDLQLALKTLRNRGILLAIASKNDGQVALSALRQHPEMVLRPEDFSSSRINWNDKAANIAEIAAELRLGLRSIVFIDDNPAERARVREALPEVLVPDWPKDPTLAASILLGMDCFDSAHKTTEDHTRAEMYSTERKRESLKTEMPTVEDWLRSLGMRVTVEEMNASSRARVAQLFNKTNQMNLATRRLSESGLVQWTAQDRRKLLAFRVSDRFGDSGLTGILTLEFDGATATIRDFILSCRVMGRQVEEAMLAVAVETSRHAGCSQGQATYLPTPKNKPCHEFWMRSGFEPDATGSRFRWDVSREYPRPASIELNFATPGLRLSPAPAGAAVESVSAG